MSPASTIHSYQLERQRLVDGGFTCESFSGNEQVMKRFQMDISRLKNVAPCNMRILYNPVRNQYELYVWRKQTSRVGRARASSMRILSSQPHTYA